MALRILILVLTCGVASSQTPTVRLRGETESTQTRKRIAEAQQKIAEGQTAAGMDQLQKVLDESGHELILVKDNDFQPARRLIQLTLASLPAEALKTYRDRMEAPAAKLLETGMANRDAVALRDLAERYFAARPTEKALDLLGELHFERGEFHEAERCWRALLPAAGPQDLVYPQPTGDAAAYRAKAILAAFAAGERMRAIAELAAFRNDHPNAKGRLAGVDGTFAETLTAFLKQKDTPPADTVALPRFPAMRPMWKMPIPRDATDRKEPRPASIPAAKTLTFFPVILNGYAYVADATRIVSFDLKSGSARVAFDLRQDAEFKTAGPVDLALPNLQGVPNKLSVADGKLFVRFGAVAEAEPKQGSCVLLAFEPLGGGMLRKRDEYPAPPGAVWQGIPEVNDGHLYATYRKSDDRGRVVAGLACYAIGQPAKPLWNTDFAERDANPPAAPTRGESIAVSGSAIVVGNQAGLTVVFERTRGRMTWAFRNAANEKLANVPRDPFPPLVHTGRVFLAPTDGDRLYALDLASGTPLWESPPLAVQQLLGIADGKVIAAIGSPHKGIRGFNMMDGSTREPQGWQNHDDPFLATYGRGIAAENGILWPTMEKLYRLNPADGSVQSIPKPGPHGNLAFGEGMLIVATPTEVWCYEGIPFEKEAVRPAPPVIQKPVVMPIVAEFDPVQAPTIQLPLVLEKTEPEPVGSHARAGAMVGSLRIGFANEHQLLAVNGEGQAVWGLDSQGRSRIAPLAIESGPRFSPHLLAVKSGVWVHVGDGERWLVTTETGRILKREKSSEIPWTAPPLALPLGKFAFPEGPGVVRCFDENHRKYWSYDAGSEASLTGVPPQCAMLGQALLVAIKRNYGIEIQRLDANTGRALWRKPAVVNADRFDWAKVAWDRSAVYIPAAGSLHALDLATGRQLWSTEIGLVDAVAWRGRHSLLVYAASTPCDFHELLQRIAGRFWEAPRVERIFGFCGTMAEELWQRTILLAAVDPETGKVSGTQTLPAGPGAKLEFRGGKLVVHSPGAVSWWKHKD